MNAIPTTPATPAEATASGRDDLEYTFTVTTGQQRRRARIRRWSTRLAVSGGFLVAGTVVQAVHPLWSL